MRNKKAAVLWTGGKDCNLALYEAKRSGYDIVALITFAMGDAHFLAHPIHFMKQQAVALNLPHVAILVQEPYRESYEAAIAEIRQLYDVDTLVTGDIAEVHGNTNWITERSKPSGMNVYLPLWHMDREHIIQKLIDLNFKTIFSCVKEPWFGKEWLGKEVSAEILERLKKIHQQEGLDICGEQGEYHTLVLDGPEYKQELIIDAYTSQQEDSIMYMKMDRILLQDK